MASDSSKLLLKANLPRTRDLSFPGRFHHNFGFEDGLFEYLLTQKDLWGERLFYMNEKQFAAWVRSGQHHTRAVPEIACCSLPGFQKISSDDFAAPFGHFANVSLNICKGGTSAPHNIAAGEQIRLKEAIDRNAVVANVGGHVTALKWLHYSSGSYLAVFVITSPTGLASLINDPALSVFSNKRAGTPGDHVASGPISSALKLYKYDVLQSHLELYQAWDTSALGATASVQWLPATFSDDTLGVIGGVFSDGKLHFLNIKKAQEPAFFRVANSSWAISLADERSDRPLLPITAFDYLGHDKVIVGTVDGALAEFELPFAHKVPEQDLHVPSFVSYVADSMVNSVSVADVNSSQVVLVNTATTQSLAIQYDQIRQGRVETGFTISTLKPIYHRGYRIFVYPDSAESFGYTFARHPHQKHSLLLKTELISSFHASEYLNHPFAIVGNSCGDIFVMNIGRKIFGVPKAHNKLVVPLKIWSLYKAPGESAFTLLGDYVPVPPDKNDIMYTFTPPEVVISAAAWNENIDGGSVYAFGTYTGLLVLERLDPVLI